MGSEDLAYSAYVIWIILVLFLDLDNTWAVLHVLYGKQHSTSVSQKIVIWVWIDMRENDKRELSLVKVHFFYSYYILAHRRWLCIVRRPSTGPFCRRLHVPPASPTSTAPVCPAAPLTLPSWATSPTTSLRTPSKTSSVDWMWVSPLPVRLQKECSREFSHALYFVNMDSAKQHLLRFSELCYFACLTTPCGK